MIPKWRDYAVIQRQTRVRLDVLKEGRKFWHFRVASRTFAWLDIAVVSKTVARVHLFPILPINEVAPLMIFRCEHVDGSLGRVAASGPLGTNDPVNYVRLRPQSFRKVNRKVYYLAIGPVEAIATITLILWRVMRDFVLCNISCSYLCWGNAWNTQCRSLKALK
jgi:hypothetical protein